MNIKLDNLDKPSNKKWKAVADFFLYTLPLYLTAIMAVPINENLKLWIGFALSMITISIKGFSKLTSDEK